MDNDFKPILIGTGMNASTIAHILASQHLQEHEVIIIDLDKKEDVERLKQLKEERNIGDAMKEFVAPPIPITRLPIEDLSDMIKVYDDRSLLRQDNKQQQKYAANRHNFRKRR